MADRLKAIQGEVKEIKQDSLTLPKDWRSWRKLPHLKIAMTIKTLMILNQDMKMNMRQTMK